MSKPIDPWQLLREAREALLAQHDPQDNIEMADRIDAALATYNSDGIVKCEFCKGSGNVPYKKPWSPRDVLGDENE